MQYIKSGKIWGLCLTAAILSACVTVQPGTNPSPSPTASATSSLTATPSPNPSASPSQPATALSQIGYGRSFGFCMGYCDHTLTVTATRMRLVHKAFREPEKYPERVIEKPTPAATWQKLTSVASFSALQALPERIGCPDCADGGSEWIELKQGQNTDRVTIEFRADLPQQAELLSELRKLYEELDPPAAE